jgi:hypothetical protein
VGEIMRAIFHNGQYNCVSKFTLQQVEALHYIKYAGYLLYYVPGLIKAIHNHNDVVRFGEHYKDCAANCPLNACDFVVIGRNDRNRRVYWIERI